MDLALAGRSVLVTGGSRGIGRAVAESFLREGARVVITGRNATQLDATAGELAVLGDVRVFAGDLAQAGERERLFAAHPTIDVLVNNAGAIPGGDLFGLALQQWIESWQLKVFGYVHLMQLYLEAMKARRDGVVVNVIGMAGQAPRFEYVCGSAGNAALIALTRAVGAKSVDWNVRVVGINPSPTRTSRIETIARRKAEDRFGDPERWREALGPLPFGRLAEPEEIGDLAVMLASPRAAYLSGTVVDVDGGQMFRGQ
ncbi:short-chain dehydrogenase [Rhodoplanes elegans]|uniref:Short-chain dehydrogenase n=1 Tax=Rhodoplanes elegans TaxID=29408 RepID=A0A327KLR6_9BRAD|nr:short-chain dehydrogenase/reductase [Rhodoplanes elegans]MBK5959496.1 short-chain dehydrogenase [Rhodoplanes elegans]RAI38954.1 short-chain dehydrogenase [Rhodoplanes elegans]